MLAIWLAIRLAIKLAVKLVLSGGGPRAFSTFKGPKPVFKAGHFL
jgi:hypothetical protein